MSDYCRKADSTESTASDRAEAGFTLVELLVVMAIMAGLLAVAYPEFSHLYARFQVSFQRDDVERQLLELPFKVRSSGQNGVLSNESGRPDGADNQIPPAETADEAPLSVLRLNLPARWQIQVDKPILYRFTGACDGGRVVFSAPQVASWQYELAAPLCRPVRDAVGGG